MQLLKPINVGHAPNDQTGDTLRDAMTIANENFAKTRAGVEAVEVSAAAAQRKADAALPAAEKGAAGGVTPLDAAGKVPAAHLPHRQCRCRRNPPLAAWRRWMNRAACPSTTCRSRCPPCR